VNSRILSLALAASLIAPATLLARDPVPSSAGAPAAADSASGWKLVAVLAIEPYEGLLQDVNCVGELTENPGLTAPNLEGMLNFFTQGKGLNGLDTKRPWGALAYTNGIEFHKVAYLPVVSLKKLLNSVGGLLRGEVKEADGITQIVQGERTIYLKEAAGWAYVADSLEDLDSLPADPIAIAGPLTKSYDVAVQVKVKNIPDAIRETFITLLKGQFEQGLKRQPGDKEGYEDRAKLIEARMAAMTEAINSLDLLTLGWSIDDDEKSTSLEVKVTPIAGTPLAQAFALNANAITSLGSLLSPAAAITGGVVGILSEDEKAEQSSQVDVSRDMLNDKIEDWIQDEALEGAVGDLVKELAESLKKTIASGRRDVAASVLLGDSISLITGAYVADPAAVEQAFKKFAAVAAKKFPAAPQPKFDADKVGSVRFHTVSVPLGKPDAIELLGPQLDIALGIGPKHVYFALGKPGLAELKQGLGSPASMAAKGPPAHLTVSVIPVVKFVAKVIDDDNRNKQSLDRLAKFAETLGDKDKIRVRTTPDSSQLTFRIDVEKDAIRLGAAAFEISRGKKSGGR